MALIALGRLQLAGHDFPQRQALLLLTYLKVEGRKERAFLAELFWPQAKTPLNNLSSTMTRLRSIDQSLVVGDRYTVGAEVAADLDVFLEHAAAGRLADGLDLYGGRFLDGLALNRLGFELQEWVLEKRAAFAATAREMAAELAREAHQAGRIEHATTMAERALIIGEDAVPGADTLAALYPILVAGNSPLAERARADAAELGADPAPVNQATDSPADTIGAANSSNPAATDIERAFFGRSAELELLERGLAAGGVLSIAGLGGVGKTQLVKELLLRTGTRFGPSHWVDGTNLESIELLPELVSKTVFPDREPAAKIDHLAEAIADQVMVIAIDGVDRLIDQLGDLAPLITDCPGLVLVLTSRSVIDLAGATHLQLNGLPLRSADGKGPGAAPRLFQACFARRAPLGAELDLDDPSIEDICELLQGLPLGIELAAGWLTVLTPSEIADGLKSRSGHTNMLRDAEQGFDHDHSSFEAVISGTWDMLDDRCRDAISRLSIFPSGFDRSAAESVGDCSLVTLRRLAGWSMISRPDGRHYRCHPLVKSFARRRLAEEPEQEYEARWAHARYLQAAVSAAPMVESFESAGVLAEVEDPVANLLTIWELLLEELDTDGLTELVDPLDRVLSRFGRDHTLLDVLRQSSRWLEESGAPASVGDRVAMHQVWLHLRLGDYQQSKEVADRLLEGNRPPQDDVFVELTRARAAIERTEGDVEASLSRLQAAQRTAGAVSPRMRALVDDDIGLCQMVLGLYPESRQSYGSVLAWARAEGSQPMIARTLLSLGTGYHDAGDPIDSLAYLLEAKSVVAVGQLDHLEPYVDAKLARALMANGDLEAARELIVDTRTHSDSGLEPWLAVEFQMLSARLAAVEDDRTRLWEDLEQALSTAVELGDVPFIFKVYLTIVDLGSRFEEIDDPASVSQLLSAVVADESGADYADRLEAARLLDLLAPQPASASGTEAGLADDHPVEPSQIAFDYLRRGRVLTR